MRTGLWLNVGDENCASRYHDDKTMDCEILMSLPRHDLNKGPLCFQT